MPTLSREDVMTRCEALAVTAAECALDGESSRFVPEPTIAEVDSADLWRLVMPSGLGGHGLGIDELAHGTRIVAHGCPASAWTISFLVMHSWLLTKFPERARSEFFTAERPWALAPAPLAPTGTLTAAEGGYRVDGSWEWATGVHHADWVMVHAVQTEPVFATRFVVVPIGDASVDDVWQTSGMRATGSNTVRLENVFVPDHRAIPGEALMFGSGEIEGDAMAGLPVPQVLALVAAAPALGAAEAAVDLFRDRIATRVLAYSLGDRARDQPVSQARLGAVMTELAATRANWDRAIARLAAMSELGALSLEERVDLRLAAALTVRRCREIIGAVGEGAGASVYFSDSPFQRLQRDVEVLKGHVIFDWDRATQIAGRAALGIEPGPTDMV